MFDGTMRKKVGDRVIDSYSIFKKGIKPEWEAPENCQGGEWQSRSKMTPQALDLFWVSEDRRSATARERARAFLFSSFTSRRGLTRHAPLGNEKQQTCPMRRNSRDRPLGEASHCGRVSGWIFLGKAARDARCTPPKKLT